VQARPRNRRRRASYGADLRPVHVADEARPKVLSGRGKSAVLGAEYVYCFRPVGMIGRDADLYTRSEIPVPISTAAEWNEQPAEFEELQHHVKALDQLLSNMADIDDMVDDLDDAAKKAAIPDGPARDFGRGGADMARPGP
jgi:hypothetical protein